MSRLAGTSGTVWFMVAAAVGLCGGAYAQFSADFEPPINADPNGLPLTGQDGWYIPVAGSVDVRAFTYAGNTPLVPANPDGDAQMIVGASNGGTAFARAQRDVSFAFADVVVITYDVLARTYGGALPATQNLGSFSTNPFQAANPQTNAVHNQLNTWVNLATPTAWNARYLCFNAAGTMDAQPGREPSAAWSNLLPDTWYRMSTTIDFTQNRITEVSIQPIGGAVTTIQPVDYYLGGGSAGGLPRPTAIRFFVGGTTAGNVMAFDNLSIVAAGAPCPADLSGDGFIDQSDLGILLADYGCTIPPEPDCPGDIDGDDETGQSDLGILLSVFGTQCP